MSIQKKSGSDSGNLCVVKRRESGHLVITVFRRDDPNISLAARIWSDSDDDVVARLCGLAQDLLSDNPPARRLDGLGNVLNAQEVSDEMGYPRHAIWDLALTGQLAYVVDASGNIRFPAYQFDDKGVAHSEVLAAHQLLSRASQNGWVALHWLTALDESGHPARLAALQGGGVEALVVLQEAENAAASWRDSMDALPLWRLSPTFTGRLNRYLTEFGQDVETFELDFFHQLDRFKDLQPHLAAGALRDTSTDLTPEQEIVILSSERKAFHDHAAAIAMAEWAATMFSSWDADQVARHLKMSPAVVKSMAAEHDLVAYLEGVNWRFPVWQFGRTGFFEWVPDVARSLAKASVDAASMNDFMLTTHDYLTLPTEPAMCPLNYLNEGNPVEIVVRLIDEELMFPATRWLEPDGSIPEGEGGPE